MRSISLIWNIPSYLTLGFPHFLEVRHTCGIARYGFVCNFVIEKRDNKVAKKHACKRRFCSYLFSKNTQTTWCFYVSSQLDFPFFDVIAISMNDSELFPLSVWQASLHPNLGREGRHLWAWNSGHEVCWNTG